MSSRKPRSGAAVFRPPLTVVEPESAAIEPAPPAHLSEAMREWWSSVMRDYVLEPHHIHLLRLCAEAMDRAQQAREILADEGVCFRDDRGNVRAHPAVAIERDARLAVARL